MSDIEQKEAEIPEPAIRKRVALRYAVTGVFAFLAIALIALCGRSYWRADSINYCYSPTGKLRLFSSDGAFSLAHSDARYSYSDPGWDWYVHDQSERSEPYLTVSWAGFGWDSHALSRMHEVQIRYWVPLSVAVLLAFIPWIEWKYSLRTMMVAGTVLAVMLGISSAAYHQEMLRKKSQRRQIIAEYDYGRFSDKVPFELQKALFHGTDFELLSLHPMPFEATPDNNIHGFKVLGRTEITQDKTRKRILAALNAGFKNAEEFSADCFDPRHALRVKYADQAIDVLICFECEAVYVYVDDKLKHTFVIADNPQPALDEVLKAADVKLAPSAYD